MYTSSVEPGVERPADGHGSGNGSEAKMPAGFRQVTADEFFAVLYADPRDIMPSNVNPEFTTWETKSRNVWGWTYPGWKHPRREKIFALKL